MRHQMIAASGQAGIVEAALIEQLPARGPGITGVAMKLVWAEPGWRGVADEHRRERFIEHACAVVAVVAVETHCMAERLNDHVAIERFRRALEPVRLLEDDIGI